MLCLKNITISIGKNAPLVSGLSVDIAPGSLRLIQGASGSGKSTLLSVISGTAGTSVRSQGDVLLFGRMVSGLGAENSQADGDDDDDDESPLGPEDPEPALGAENDEASFLTSRVV